MMSFDVTSSPSFLCITPDRVGVACNDHAHSSFTIDMYCLRERGEEHNIIIWQEEISHKLKIKNLYLETLEDNFYMWFLFSLSPAASFTGDPEHSHQAAITGLASFPRLQLFASTGLDQTLRIWTTNNHPVRYGI